MAPKKQKKNPFQLFVEYYKEREEAKGAIFRGGYPQVYADPRCSAEWKALSAEEKEEFKVRAKQTNKWYDSSPIIEKPKPRNESPIIIDVAEKIRQQTQYEETMKTVIEETIGMANLLGSLPDLSFFLIHVNYFYTKNLDSCLIDYYPAEYAIIEFSLSEGQKRHLHQIIRAKFELGYTGEAREHSNSTHKLTEDMPEGESNFLTMYNGLVNFLKQSKLKNGKYPPLYTSSKIIKIAPGLIERITEAAGVSSDTFDLYSLEHMFGTIMSRINELTQCNMTHIAEAELAKESFSFAPNLECDYHRVIPDSSIHCSLAIVRQWIFTICDYCCDHFNIKMIRGLHEPEENPKNKLNESTLELSMQGLSVKEPSIQSATGVSSNYKPVYQLTADEDKQRRESNHKLTIIDHSKIREEVVESYIVPSAAESGSWPQQKGWTTMQTSSFNWNNSDPAPPTAPVINDTDYPAIGLGRGRGRGRRRN